MTIALLVDNWITAEEELGRFFPKLIINKTGKVIAVQAQGEVHTFHIVTPDSDPNRYLSIYFDVMIRHNSFPTITNIEDVIISRVRKW